MITRIVVGARLNVGHKLGGRHEPAIFLLFLVLLALAAFGAVLLLLLLAVLLVLLALATLLAALLVLLRLFRFVKIKFQLTFHSAQRQIKVNLPPLKYKN